ncbi:MAG: NAD-dependent malic enzyme [Pseudomonadota bacterium]
MPKIAGSDYRIIQALRQPGLNKGTAFSLAERKRFGLLGLLPPHIETLEEQTVRAYHGLHMNESDIERHIYMRNLQDQNETLFYNLVVNYVEEIMPLIYTPVVGAACEQFSEIYRQPRGLFISYPDRDRIDEILDNAPHKNVEAIVVTDGERILGLGDQGAGGMGIPIGKLSLYTAVGGVHPATTLPMLLDVGTNNQERLKDPLYIGWRHERVTGDDYFDFVDRFVQAVKRKWPKVLLQFEDFAQPHAAPLLARYRDQLCTFNDDIQGTAAVAVGTLIAAAKVTGTKLRDHRVAFLGAGSAGAGIAEQIVAAMIKEGLPDQEARARIFMVDRNGLLHDKMTGLMPFQQKLVQPRDAVAGWASGSEGQIGLEDVVAHAKPTILIGVSGQPGLFSEAIVRAMAAETERPIIFPLSNPTSRSEAVPEDLIRWTDGRALIATGSPFKPVVHDGTTYNIAQSNNTYIFPAMGLGILAAEATRVTDGMFMVAAEALADSAGDLTAPGAALLPAIGNIRAVSRQISRAVARQAQADGVAPQTSEDALDAKLAEKYWTPAYADLSDLA